MFRRHPGNPILTPEMWPYTVNAVFNPGVTTFGDHTLLLVRVEDRSGVSHLGDRAPTLQLSTAAFAQPDPDEQPADPERDRRLGERAVDAPVGDQPRESSHIPPTV